jgi:hypothetical protein
VAHGTSEDYEQCPIAQKLILLYGAKCRMTLKVKYFGEF